MVGAQEGVGEVQVGVLSLVEALQGGGETVDDRGGGRERGGEAMPLSLKECVIWIQGGVERGEGRRRWVGRWGEGGHFLGIDSCFQLLRALNAAADSMRRVHMLQQLPGRVLGLPAAAAGEEAGLWRQSGN